MHLLSPSILSIWTSLSVSILWGSVSAWPAYHQRQAIDTPLPGQNQEPTFEEEYDFIIAGGAIAI